MAIFSTGKELVSQCESKIGSQKIGSQKLESHQIFDSNSVYLKILLSTLPLMLKVFPIVPDDKSFFQKTVKKIMKDRFDVIISSGSVSKGKYDIISDCLNEIGFKILFHRVKIKPGKPILFAHKDHTFFYFGLPGNPISTAVCVRFFVFYFLRRCFDLKNEQHFRLKLDNGYKKPFGMTFFLKSHIYIDSHANMRGKILDGQESFKIKPLSECNGWIILSDDKEEYIENDLTLGNFLCLKLS